MTIFDVDFKIIDTLKKSTSLNENLNYTAARIVMDKYSAPSSNLKEPEQWNEWIEQVSMCSELIESFQSGWPTTTSNENNNKMRSFCEKVSILRYYVEHLAKSNTTYFKYCNILWTILSPKNDTSTVTMKSLDWFKKILGFIQLIDKQMKENVWGKAV